MRGKDVFLFVFFLSLPDERYSLLFLIRSHIPSRPFVWSFFLPYYLEILLKYSFFPSAAVKMPLKLNQVSEAHTGENVTTPPAALSCVLLAGCCPIIPPPKNSPICTLICTFSFCFFFFGTIIRSILIDWSFRQLYTLFPPTFFPVSSSLCDPIWFAIGISSSKFSIKYRCAHTLKALRSRRQSSRWPDNYI